MFTLIDAPDSQPFLLILLFLYIQIDKVCLSKIIKFLLIFSVLIPPVLIDNEVINILFYYFSSNILNFHTAITTCILILNPMRKGNRVIVVMVVVISEQEAHP